MAKIKNSNIFTISLILFSLAVIFSFSVNDVSAAPQIYVNATGGNDANSGTSWQYAKQSIGNGIGAVDSNGNVTIANGTYSGTNNRNININKNVNIIGMSKDNVIIDAGALDKVFNIQSGRTVNISNLTIRNGRVTTSSRNGGAIYNQGTLTVNNCNLRNNRADRPSWSSDSNGGAIYNTGTLTITGSTFNNNTANDYGGAIYNTGTLTITGSSFTSNSITGDTDYTGGGAIYSDSTGSFSITNTSFSGNSASTGGAIISMTAFSVSGSTFTNNTADLNGGAISFGINNLNPATGTMTITSSNFTGNTGGSNGGAVWSYGTTIVSNSNFTSNHADENGGAIRTWGSLNITSNNLLNNSATTSGGAISNYQGTITAHFNRIVGNSANDIRAEYNGASSSVNAENNWWGTNFAGTNPVSAGRITAESGATVDANPWLVLRISASPTRIPVGGTSNVTADLTWNSNNVQPAGGYVPDGTPVSFTGTLGTLNPINTATTNGIATTVFTGAVPGIGNVSAIIDNQTVSRDIIIGTSNILIWVYDNTGVQDWLYGLSPQYIVEIYNDGPDDAYDVVVTITLPSGLQLNGYNPETGGTVNIIGNTLIWNVGFLCNGGSTGIDILARLTETGTIPLTATATPGNNADTWDTYVPPSADIQVTQTVNNSSPQIGDTVTFTVTAKNNGPNNATNIDITNLIPAGLTNVTVTPSIGTYADGVWTIPTLNNGTTATLTITGTATSTTLTNTATLIAVDQDNWNLTNDSQTIKTPSGSSSSSNILIWVYDNTGVQDWLYGLSPQYIVEIYNDGPDDAYDVVVTITLPSGLQLNGYNPETGGTVNIIGNTLIWNVGFLCNGGSTGIDILARLTETGTIPLTATATPGNNADTWDTYVPPSADIQVTQTVNNSSPQIGDTVTFTVTAKNNGPNNATNIDITNLIPAGLTNVTVTPSIGTYADGVWTIPTLNNGTTATLTITGTATSTTLTNTATLIAVDQDNWNLTNDSQTIYTYRP